MIGHNTTLYESPECEVFRVDPEQAILSASIERWGEEDLFENE